LRHLIGSFIITTKGIFFIWKEHLDAVKYLNRAK